MFSIAKNSHALQSLAVRFMAGVNPAIEHNLQKIAAIKKAMYLVNLEGVPGDYLEFGMYEGTSFIGAFEAYRSTRLPTTPKRAFHGFDSFEGFKYFSESDTHPFFREGDFKSSYAKTMRRIERHVRNRAEWSITPGYVEETIGGTRLQDRGIEAVAVAFIDVDLGAPGLSPGSIILLDDFFAYRGSERKGVAHAFKEFREAHPHMNFRRLLDYGYGGQGFILADMDPAN
jgi:hypothetical protein